ncbi:hypothetical protein [Rhizorhabdus argentea]|uniref:hypothetical protein n=1 Tax=Rhizorhabdus argentea TaxID=1387174 RepID=UPI0030ECE180
MFERRIPTENPASAAAEDILAPIHSALAVLNGFAAARRPDDAPQYENSAGCATTLAARYAAANTITRRRFDAILREAETTSMAGLGLILGRAAHADAATAAAARFLGNSLGSAVRRLEKLVSTPAN